MPEQRRSGRSRWTDSSRAAPALVRPYVKCGIYRNHTWKRHTGARPLTYTTITALEVTVHQPEPPKPRPRPTPARRPQTTTTTNHPRRHPTATVPSATAQARCKPSTRTPSRWPTDKAIPTTCPRHRPHPRHQQRDKLRQLLRPDVPVGPPRPANQDRPSHLPEHANTPDSSPMIPNFAALHDPQPSPVLPDSLCGSRRSVESARPSDSRQKRMPWAGASKSSAG
jgi:hypothetical protein